MTTLAMHPEQHDTGRRPASVPDDVWQAISSRDGRRDGQFVYGVRTTHIYCRPSCPSRQPRRDNVELFTAPASAEQAGYRPCKRCDPALVIVPDRAAALVQRACAFIDEHLDDTLPLATIARAAHGSSAHVQRTFKRVLGISPRAYVAAKREHRLRGALRTGQSVGRAVFEAGYASGRPVYGPTTAPLGMTPATYRTGGAGATIHYTVVTSPLGQLLVAATERGVCSVRLGDTAAELEAGLRSEFAAAQLEREPGPPRAWVSAIRAALSGRGDDALDLPVDVRATAFQRRVWDALRDIPSGETRTYSEVAQSVGSPRAVRAVAHACAANPVAVVVPCHRVIRTGGALAGYRWGIDRKRALLDAEGASTGDTARKSARARSSGRKRASATS
jgi:AraC family transcriptional regulator, regulatory protein of adaptative response / methylated-DNA-[protein]-cysteine methyltransferase